MKLLIVKDTGEVKEMVDTDFNELYYRLPNWEIIDIPDKTVNEIKEENPLIEIFPYNGDVKTPAWQHKENKKIYKCKIIPIHRYIYKNRKLKNSVDTYPENFEEILENG